jgi:hypothetical protein
MVTFHMRCTSVEYLNSYFCFCTDSMMTQVLWGINLGFDFKCFIILKELCHEMNIYLKDLKWKQYFLKERLWYSQF